MGIWGKLYDSNEHKTSRRDHLEGFSFILENFFFYKFAFIQVAKKSNNKKTSPEEYEDESMIPESSEKLIML